jgi:protein required for attachment to host cells
MAADSSRGRLFEIVEPHRELREIGDFSNPQGRANNRELVSDADGRFSARHAGPRANSGGQRITPVEHETQLFSKTLARYLEKARSKRRYSKLYLIAPPGFLGLMRENLSKEVRKVTAEEINKGISWFDSRDIARYVQPRRRSRSA